MEENETQKLMEEMARLKREFLKLTNDWKYRKKDIFEIRVFEAKRQKLIDQYKLCFEQKNNLIRLK